MLCFLQDITIGHHVVESFSTVATSQRKVVTTYILVDKSSNGATATTTTCCYEMGSLPGEADKPDEDEVEILFPTARRRFRFDKPSPSSEQNNNDQDLITIRRTSFGCGKHGYQIWPTSLALSLYFMAHPDQIQGKRVMELGAGCGLPSVLFRDVLDADAVLATDFWLLNDEYDADSDKDDGRLVPLKYHGMNLEYNVALSPADNEERNDKKAEAASVQHLDWHDSQSVGAARDDFGADLIVGCDLIYYPDDVEPLWKALQMLMEEGKRNNSPTILLCSPIQPIVRDALPNFRQFLKEQDEATMGDYRVEMSEMTMYENEVGNSAESFLRMLISKR